MNITELQHSFPLPEVETSKLDQIRERLTSPQQSGFRAVAPITPVISILALGALASLVAWWLQERNRI